MLGRRTPRRRRLGLVVACAGVLAVFPSILAVAAPVSASAASLSPAATAAGTSAAQASPAGPPSEPAGSAPVKHACTTSPRPGQATCLALMRTDAAGHVGMLAANAVPPGYGPADLQAAYQLPSATAGHGATVAVVDAYDDPSAAADLATYRAQYGLPACTTANGCFRKVDQRGGTDYPVRDAGWAEEISLDLDTISATCPNCHILLVEADDDTLANLGTAENEAVALGAKYISNSYSASESAGEAQADSQYYDHPGVVITASAGDSGYGTGFPAASPHVVAVGGTSLVRDPSSTRGWSETVWSGTGSGCSTNEPKPAWQTDSGCANRTMNDVSAVADPSTGVAIYDSYQVGGWAVFGGTSVSAPLIAATYALAGTPVGGTYPASYLYQHPSALNDVTSGTDATGGCAPAAAYLCTAGAGYDGPTGLGTPDGVAAFQAGPHGTVKGIVTNAATGAPVAGAQVTIGGAATVTNASGHYQTTALTGGYTVTASKYGYASGTASGVTVTGGGTVTENLTLRQLPTATVSGTVTDASGQGWPLYAEIQVPGIPVVAYTNPATGRYQLTLPVTGSAYTLHVSAVYSGYQASDTTITPTAASLSQDVGLQVDPAACTALGYQPVYNNGLRETFDTGAIPAGWTEDGTDWVFNNPNNLPNGTGGSGGFALADGPDINSDIVTATVDLSADPSPVVRFGSDLNSQNGTGIVWVSTDGGSHWQPVADNEYIGNLGYGQATETFPLPMAAGQSNVKVMFQANGSGFLWEIDNIFIGEPTCQPVTGGGLVVGHVRDLNTGQPVDGAIVTSSARPGQPVSTAPAPDDPAVGGGLFWMFASSAGAQTLTASASDYSTATTNVTVTGGSAVTSADISLAAGRLAVSSAKVAATEPMGATATTRLTVTNTGSAPATLRLNEQQGSFTPAGQAKPSAVASGQPAPAAAPARQVSGHFTTRLAAGRTAATSSPAKAAGTATTVSPATAPWATVAHYPEDVFDNTAVTDPATGDVYSVGGVDNSGYTSSRVYVYHPSTGTWSQLPDMPYSLEAPAAAVIGGKLYVTSGYDLPDNVEQPAMEIYDPHTGLWSSGSPIPQPGYGSATAVLDGKMYVIGGCAANGVCTSNDVQVYDPASDSWTAAASYPLEISFLGCGAISGKLYCAGGFDHNAGDGTASAYVYDPAANTWSPIASLPVNLWGGGTAAANGQLLVSGGVAGFDDLLTSQGYAYDPGTDTWSALPDSGTMLYRGGSACGFYRIGGLDVNGNANATTQQLPGYGECDGGTGVPWLSASPGQATLAPGRSTTITLTLNAADPSISQPGSYTAALRVDGNTPYQSPASAITLTATPPKTWGELAGTVSGKACDGSTAPVPGATVEIDGSAGSWTLASGGNGKYGIWLDASANNPLTVIVTANGWLAQAQTVTIAAGKATTDNITLSPAGC